MKIPNLKDIQGAPFTDAYLFEVTPLINSAARAVELYVDADDE